MSALTHLKHVYRVLRGSGSSKREILNTPRIYWTGRFTYIYFQNQPSIKVSTPYVDVMGLKKTHHRISMHSCSMNIVFLSPKHMFFIDSEPDVVQQKNHPKTSFHGNLRYPPPKAGPPQEIAGLMIRDY